jgi:DNA helicase-2/ATP-dependent DNA helicase PcrA
MVNEKTAKEIFMEKNFADRFIQARRKAIALDFKHLNNAQIEAVTTVTAPLLLLAGAGSGKTTVLINRIANLLKYGCGSDCEDIPEDISEEDLIFLEEYVKSPTKDNSAKATMLCAVEPVEPWRVIAITFTNKAAGEMKERLGSMLGPTAEDIWAMTFHSACARILRRDIDKLGYERSFAIYDTTDTASLMKRILKDFDIDEKILSHKTVLNYISNAKDSMVFPDEFMNTSEKTGDMRRKMVARAYVEYAKRMKSANALDFDDLILLTVRLFKENSDVLNYYQKRFKYILVDEYQDTNNLQYLLASLLSGGHGNICVVGDDDQSIYKFRGATIENILSFEKQFKNAKVLRLEQNYRSTGYILDAAGDVITNNRGRKGKKLWTEKELGEKPRLHIVDDEREEAQLVADTIIASAEQGRRFDEHAVLYRMNAQSNQFETAFKRSGIPYRIFGGTGFYDRAEIKDMLAYLCVIHSPHDDVRLMRIVNTPARGLGQTTLTRVAEIASQLDVSVFSVIKDARKYEALGSAAARLHLFADMIIELRELSESLPLDELYDELLSKTGYIRMLEEKKSDDNIARIENVKELKTNIMRFMNDNGGTLFDFLNETALYTDLNRDDTSSDRVAMMTMHSAKGLEFDSVFIVGAEEGLFPNARVIGNPEEIEEERRLCYVAMTRAMRKLFFTSAKKRMLFGKTTPARQSRFVDEISHKNLEIHEESSGGYDFDFSGGFARNSTGHQNGYETSRDPFYESSYEYPSYETTKPNPKRETFSFKPSTSQANSHNYNKGDIVKHKAFGRGMILSIAPAGGDALMEIAFDEVGTKRLMLNSVARYLEPVSS